MNGNKEFFSNLDLSNKEFFKIHNEKLIANTINNKAMTRHELIGILGPKGMHTSRTKIQQAEESVNKQQSWKSFLNDKNATANVDTNGKEDNNENANMQNIDIQILPGNTFKKTNDGHGNNLDHNKLQPVTNLYSERLVDSRPVSSK